MINITEAAQLYLAKLLANQEPGTQIRMFVINPGTAFAKCSIFYCRVDAIKPTDIVLKFEKFSVYIDEISAPLLKEAKIDFVINQLNSRLILEAPNVKLQEAADNAPLIERVEHVIQSQINSQLAVHGGRVLLIEITDNGYAVLQFHGGCNGCSMVNFTLKESIEKQLLNTFPNELKGVKDLTEHQHGNHSYC